MIKTGITVVLVESVVEAIKFYTEKLGFDLISVRQQGHEDEEHLAYADLRKGKCCIVFREPTIEESAEFSQVKYCLGRGTAVQIELKDELDKFFVRCQDKEVKILQPLIKQASGERSFVIKDPFGLRIIAVEYPQDYVAGAAEVSKSVYDREPASEDSFLESLVTHLRSFGVARRAAKKYGKRWWKNRE